MSHRAAGWSIRLRLKSDNSRIENLFRDCLTAFTWRGQETEEIIRLRHALSVSDCLIAQEKFTSQRLLEFDHTAAKRCGAQARRFSGSRQSALTGDRKEQLVGIPRYIFHE